MKSLPETAAWIVAVIGALLLLVWFLQPMQGTYFYVAAYILPLSLLVPVVLRHSAAVKALGIIVGLLFLGLVVYLSPMTSVDILTPLLGLGWPSILLIIVTIVVSVRKK